MNPPAGAKGARRAIAEIGPLAAEALAEPGPGRIVAAFRRSFYLDSGHGRLACVGLPEIGRGPLNALVVGTAGAAAAHANGRPAVRPGDRVTVSTEGIAFPGGFRLTIAGAANWTPRSPPPTPGPDVLREGLAAFRRWVEAQHGRDHGPILPAVLGLHVSETGAKEPSLIAARRLRRGARAMGDWLAASRPQAPASPPPPAAAALFGLGPGLTPAGDDFVGGMLIALHALGRADGAELAGRLGRWALAESCERTGAISRAHLRAAARGMGAEPVHRVLHCLLTPGAPGLDAAVAAAAAVGHSSGLDALAGAATVLRAAAARQSLPA